MIARVKFDYNAADRFLNLSNSSEIFEKLKAMFPEGPQDEEARLKSYNWPHEALIDLETDGRWLTDQGFEYAIKNFKGTMPLKTAMPSGEMVTVYVQVPHVGLLAIDEVEVCEDYCTDQLQRKLNEGWRILCVCPPNAARRPDYILGRTRDKS